MSSSTSPKGYLVVAFIIALSPFLLLIPIWINYDVLLSESHAHGGSSADVEEYKQRTLIYLERTRLQDGSVAALPLPETNYIQAEHPSWTPYLIRMQIGQTYMFVVFTVDVIHGFSLIMDDSSYNTVIVPGSPATVHMTPSQAGEFRLLCNEFCGAKHDRMASTFIVE